MTDGEIEREGTTDGRLVLDGSVESDGVIEGLDVSEGRREIDGSDETVGIELGTSELTTDGAAVVGDGVMLLQVMPSPRKPLLQVHEKPPLLFSQEAFGWHGAEMHSSRSVHPTTGSPKKPVWQMQMKDASMLTQLVLTPQGTGLSMHSFLSVHVSPSPTYPALQAHAKVPSPSTQKAFLSQGYGS